jgi:molecular chaperone DnaJ|tara:strand:- start:5435 stop:6241 length:807 start_codon:yes stop_codon:yes gene_type:complete
MSDPYTTLGVDPNSTDKEIKSAFRRLAHQHHPDREGGNEDKMKAVNDAYRQIRTQEDRDTLRRPQQPQGNPFGGVPPGFEDMFANFGFQNGRRPQMNPNKDIHINYHITMEEVVAGVNKDIEISLPAGKKTTVHVKIPPGIKHGQRVKFAGCGETTHKGFTSGDLYVTVMEQLHPLYVRQDNNCCIKQNVDLYTAMTGGELEVSSIDNSRYKLKINPGTQPGTRLRIPEAGFPILNTRRTGDLIVTINVVIPAISDVNTCIRDLNKEI